MTAQETDTVNNNIKKNRTGPRGAWTQEPAEPSPMPITAGKT